MLFNKKPFPKKAYLGIKVAQDILSIELSKYPAFRSTWFTVQECHSCILDTYLNCISCSILLASTTCHVISQTEDFVKLLTPSS